MVHRILSVICSASAVVACLSMAAPGGPAAAADTPCQLRDTNALVTVVLCPPGLNQAAWRDAGVRACGARKPCAAWIWDDPAKAPATTPPTPTEMAPEEIAAAVAIWVNESNRLITISPVSQ